MIPVNAGCSGSHGHAVLNYTGIASCTAGKIITQVYCPGCQLGAGIGPVGISTAVGDVSLATTDGQAQLSAANDNAVVSSTNNDVILSSTNGETKILGGQFIVSGTNSDYIRMEDGGEFYIHSEAAGLTLTATNDVEISNFIK